MAALRWCAPALAALTAVCSPQACAHSPIAGVGHFYAGMLHPLFVPAHLLALVAMGLWLGQRWPVDRQALAVMLLAVPPGMAAGAWTGATLAAPMLLAVTAVVAVAAATARGGSVAARALVAAMLGALIGADSLPDGLAGRARAMSLAGTWLAVLLGQSLVVMVAEGAQKRIWAHMAVRVVASWAAAAAILALTFAITAGGAGRTA